MKVKIFSEEYKLDNGIVEGTFTLSNNTVVKFEITDEYCNQWGCLKEEAGETIDRLFEIQSCYFGNKITYRQNQKSIQTKIRMQKID